MLEQKWTQWEAIISMSAAFSGCWRRTLSRSQSTAETVAWRWSGLKQSPSSSILLGPAPRWVRACPWSSFEKSVGSRCFNGSQSCDRSDILPQTIVINITPLGSTDWHRVDILNSIFCNLRHHGTSLLPLRSDLMDDERWTMSVTVELLQSS